MQFAAKPPGKSPGLLHLTKLSVTARTLDVSLVGFRPLEFLLPPSSEQSCRASFLALSA